MTQTQNKPSVSSLLDNIINTIQPMDKLKGLSDILQKLHEKEITVPTGEKAQIYCDGNLITTLSEGTHRIPASATVEFLTIYTIEAGQKGLVYRDGMVTSILNSGIYELPKTVSVKIISTEEPVSTALIQSMAQMPEEAQKQFTHVTVQKDQLALITVRKGLQTATEAILCEAGDYVFWTDPSRNIQYFDTSKDIVSVDYKEIELLGSCIAQISLNADQIAIHKVNGLLRDILHGNQTCCFWNIREKHTFETIELDGSLVDMEALNGSISELEPWMEHFEVPENHFGFYSQNGCIKTLLRRPGNYAFWVNKKCPQKPVFATFEYTRALASEEAENFMKSNVISRSETHFEDGSAWDDNRRYTAIPSLISTQKGPGVLCENNGILNYVRTVEKDEVIRTWELHKLDLENSDCTQTEFCRLPPVNAPLQLELKDQSILTKDNINIKINIICTYQICSYEDFCKANVSFIEALGLIGASRKEDYSAISNLYTTFQLSLRDYISTHTLEESLASRQEINQVILEQLKARECEFGVEILQVKIKDFNFNSAYQEMQNQVLMAEKKAQIKAIERREEVNNNRTLLNTAKLMQENQMMLTLRKLEVFEKVCSSSKEVKLAMEKFLTDAPK